MPRKCFKNYPNTIGFPCILCEDMHECANDLPEGYIELKGFSGIYVNKSEGQIVFTGVLGGNTGHNCDEMGCCSSISHVIYRCKVIVPNA